MVIRRERHLRTTKGEEQMKKFLLLLFLGVVGTASSEGNSEPVYLVYPAPGVIVNGPAPMFANAEDALDVKTRSG